MLEELSKRHEDWKGMAMSMGAGDHAEDAVQDMYIRIFTYAKDKDLCNTYIWFTLRNIVADYIKKDKRLPKTNLEDTLELTHHDKLEEERGYQLFLDCLDAEMKKWHWFDRMIFDIYVNKDKSMRGLADSTKIGVSTIFNTIKRCKQKIKENLGEDWADFINEDYERL